MLAVEIAAAADRALVPGRFVAAGGAIGDVAVQFRNAAGLDPRREFVGRAGALRRSGVDPVLARLRAVHRAVLIDPPILLEKRILPQFLGDEVGDFQIVELEQLDRLLQLRRHDESLRLPQIQSLDEAHPAAAGQ